VGQQYNRKPADLLAVQNDIAREVSQRLGPQLSAQDQQELTKGSTGNPEAYQLYLKGKYYTNKLTKDGSREGHRLLQSGHRHRSKLWLGLQRLGLQLHQSGRLVHESRRSGAQSKGCG
jgi:hypothetical protein